MENSPLATSSGVKAKAYMTIEELAEHFHVDPRTIANWKRDGLLVYFQVRRVVRFDVAA